MIEHLRGRERKLEPLGWTGPETEWIALVCLYSGVFTRAQFCHYFGDAHRWKAGHFVQTLLDRKAAVEGQGPVFNGGGKTCRISSKPIYRALGVENIRHRRKARQPVVMRRLLSLDFVLEHPGMNWLPAEPKKAAFFEELGLSRRLIPRRIYYGAVGAQKRYFALKLPLAGDARTVTFAYVDPGHQTDRELHSWGAAHGQLWEALREKGRQVRVIGIGAENETVDRTAHVLRVWAATAPKETREGRTLQQEIKKIDTALRTNDGTVLAEYGGFNAAMKKGAELESPPEAKVTEGVSIDDYGAWRATTVCEPGGNRMKKRANRRVFRATNDRMLNATPSEGGVWQDSDKRCGKATFLYLSHSYRFIPYSSACPAPIQENRGGRERPPPLWGGALSPLFIPAGRLGTAPRRGR